MSNRLLIFLLASVLQAADWEGYRSGPFEIWTEASEKEARQLLVRLEQVRHLLGVYLGKNDPVSVWPLRVLIRKNQPAAAWILGRDAMISALTANTPPSASWMRQTVTMLLEANARRMPPDWEAGLISFLSTLEATGPRIKLGAPPADAARNLAWARVHWLATNPEYGSRFRVLLNNLQQGADEDVAFRNSIAMTRQQLDQAAGAHLANPAIEAVWISGRPLAERDFVARPLDTTAAMAAMADLTGNVKILPAGTREAMEIAGLAAARAGRKAEALDLLRQAIAQQSASPRVHLEYGKLLDQPDAKRNAFVEAAKRNAQWPEPYLELAKLETAPARVAHYLKEAALRAPRQCQIWVQYAQALTEADQLSEASKAWFSAELAAADSAEREQVRQARLRFIEQRAAREEELKRLQAEERQRELDRLRTEAMNRIREAEAKANRSAPPRDPNQKIEPWWEDKQPAVKLRGRLEKVDCLPRGQARLSLRSQEGKWIPLLIADPSQVVILGGGEASLRCGVQKPAPVVHVEYRLRADPKLATAGDVASLEFQ
ncbi:MAG: hypothetical protein NZV14_08535 [Bryobacteraceae bacterium]|nr:hypothetical protein [Bryobacteraceae bacterium]MDW8378194.1 hypothetical protein [Bryobacterales bacterium]